MAQEYKRYTNLREVRSATEDTNLRLAGQRIKEIVTLLSGNEFTPWTFFNGKDILDLGCGNTSLVRDGAVMPAHLCRILGANGAHVYGLDVGAAPNETLYTHMQQDIIPLVMDGKLANLSELDGKKFDVINSSFFAGPPSPSPILLRELHRSKISLDDFRTKLIGETVKLVKESGFIYLDGFCAQKIRGRMITQQRPKQ